VQPWAGPGAANVPRHATQDNGTIRIVSASPCPGDHGLGARTSIEDAREHLKTYLGAGGDFVDTAHGYGDGAFEQALGTMFDDLLPRDQLVICTKAGVWRRMGTRVVNTSRRALMHQVDTSLERRGTPYVDLWLVHDDTPLDETLCALEWAVSSGLARHVAVSNYSRWQAAHAATLMSGNRVPLVETRSSTHC
jgi:aryl-alcohol dehydrogenase-like predicted oxidoreductase